jgi:cyclic pyranopterin phosphate synthase
MVDISGKPSTERVAKARGRVLLSASAFKKLKEGALEKGDVLGAARLAGILAAKKTPELIPLCHPIGLSAVEVDFHLDEEASAVEIEVTVRTNAATGVEMEALTGVAVSALTIYDMCKPEDPSITISDIRLTYKAGGAKGTYRRPEEP